ncbi:hypothetical protein [Streptomyces sp. NPDC001502]
MTAPSERLARSPDDPVGGPWPTMAPAPAIVTEAVLVVPPEGLPEVPE